MVVIAPAPDPPGTRLGPAAAQSVRVGLSELVAPRSDRLVTDNDTAGHHHLLDLAEAEREAVIQPHTVADDLHRESVALIQRR